MKLDIGCGNAKVEGCLGIDINRTRDVDILADVEVGLPFRDSVFDEVYMNHVLEHVDDVIRVLEEVYRVLKPGGKVFIRVPCFSNFHALTHPQHKHAFHHDSLTVVTSESKEPYTNARFKIIRNDYIFKSRKLLIPKIVLNYIFNKHKHLYVSTILAYLFPADEILFILEKEIVRATRK